MYLSVAISAQQRALICFRNDIVPLSIGHCADLECEQFFVRVPVVKIENFGGVSQTAAFAFGSFVFNKFYSSLLSDLPP